MKQLTLLLKSFRLLNVFSMLLLLVGFRVYLYRNFINSGDYLFSRTVIEFVLFLVAIGLVTMAGYLVNDICDVKVDRINKPEKQLPYSVPILWRIYIGINTVSVLLIFGLSVNKIVQFILLSTIVLLFLYSYFLQKLPLIGNLVVAVLAGVLPFLYYYFEIIEKVRGYVDFELTYQFLLINYSFFGFFLMLFREVVKDIEDTEGDISDGYKTLPILIGVKKTRRILLFFMHILLLVISFSLYLLENTSHFLFLVSGLIILYVISILKLYQNLFSKASLFLKLALFFGVLILFML